MGQDPSSALWSCAINCLLYRADQRAAPVKVRLAGATLELSGEDYWREFYARVFLQEIDTDPALLEQAEAPTSQLSAARARPAVVDEAAERTVLAEALELTKRARALLAQPGAVLDPQAFMAGRLEAEHPEDPVSGPD
jgi:hypothetical protein